MPSTPNTLITTADTAVVLGRDVATVHRMVKRGELTAAVKAPGKRGAFLFDQREVDRLAAKRRDEPAD